ncbi:MAG: class II fumarate hydratase [Actinomycetota bacterium]
MPSSLGFGPSNWSGGIFAVSEFRIEKDTMGEVKVPAHGYWGASTQRAVENFPISGITFPPRFIRALALIKGAAAEVNSDLGHLDGSLAQLISAAAKRVADGEFNDHFPIDIFQTGSGTSTNTNANEVIANVANEAAGSELGAKTPVHPNDHVNFCQSSNDVIPSTIHVAALEGIVHDLVPALERLRDALRAKADEFANVVKTGRTHLMDATPVTLGQEFGGYGRQIDLGIDRIRSAAERLGELALGGTAVGTGINADPRFASAVIAKVASQTGLDLFEAKDHFAAQGSMDACVEMSGALKTVAVALVKISNDLRWMNSGPRAGIAEIRLPDLQPGSSIMPGKVNPVIPEAAIMVAAQVIGSDATITFAGSTGSFELNVALPVIAHNLIQAVELLTSTSNVYVDKCINLTEADVERCRTLVEGTDIIATALNPILGYEKAAAIVKEAVASQRTIREVAL